MMSHTLSKATQTTQDLVRAAIDLLKAGLPEKDAVQQESLNPVDATGMHSIPGHHT
jgi:hypothetical protein